MNSGFETFEGLEERTQWDSERSLQPQGELARSLRDLFVQISIEDLEFKPTGKAVHVTLRSPALTKYTRKLHDLLYHRLKSEISTLKESVYRITHSTAADSHAFTIPSLELRTIWERVENLVYLPEPPSGHIAKPTLGQIFGAGRQQVFVILMFASLFVRIGINPTELQNLLGNSAAYAVLSAAVSVLLLAAGITAALSTHMAAKNELQSGQELELQRIRGFLTEEAIKVAESTEKIKRTLVRDYCRSMAKLQQVQITSKRAIESKPLASPAPSVDESKAMSRKSGNVIAVVINGDATPIKVSNDKPAHAANKSQTTPIPGMKDLATRRREREIKNAIDGSQAH